MGKVSRVRPRINMDVNEYWICDRGRYGFREVQEGGVRLKDPIVRKGEGFELAEWSDALEFASSGLMRAKESSPGSIAILASPTLTTEELYLLKKIGAVLKTERIFSDTGGPSEPKLYGLISPDPYPNSAGVKDMGIQSGPERIEELINAISGGYVKVLYTVGEDLFRLAIEEQRPRLREALAGLTLLIAEDYKLTDTVKLAHVILPGASPYEKDGTFTNDTGRVQRVRCAIPPPGTAKPDWEIISLLGSAIQAGSFEFEGPSGIMHELAGHVPSYGGINYENTGMLGTEKTGESAGRE
jgi:predicted molibdopterin-dependent oxidoreductase YjgC